MSSRQLDGQLYEVVPIDSKPSRQPQMRFRSVDNQPQLQHVIFDQDAGVTRNYLGETVANIYSKPSPLGGKLFATVDGAARSVQATDDFGLRRSDHSFRSANIHADFGSLPAEGQRREVIQRAPPFGTSIIQSPLLQGLTRPALFGAGLQNLGRPQVITNLQTADRKLSIGSHDGLFNQPGIVQGQLLSPKEPTIPRGTLSDGGSVASSARRMERSSWYSNKQNEYDWTALDKQEIKKFKVYSKGFYVVKTHVDNEIEEEFRADVWRERQNRAPQAPQVIQSKAFESIPAKLSLPKPTGTVEMEYEEIKRKYYSDSKAAPSVSSQQSENKIPARTIFNQEQIHENPINAPSRSPTDARRTWPHNSQGRILNSEDFRSLLNAADPHQQQNGPYIYQKVEISEHPIGKTEFGDEVYGFDTRGYPIIDIEKSSRRPIYGFTPQSRTPVYGISREGFPQTHFDSFGRPFIGFDLSGLPVYDLKSSRYQVKELDTKHNAILGYTRDRRPIYDVSSANYIATGIDSKTGQFRYGYDWKWKPVLEDDIKKIEELVKSHPVVASDEYKAKIFGFDDDKNPIYSFTSDHKPIFGYTVDHCPVFGICKDGSFVLTFDPDMKPVYGFSSDFNPIYDPKIIQSGQKVFYPPGVELKVTDYGKLYDVWGRAVNKDKVVPISQLNNQAPSRRQSFSSADLDFYDQKGQQYPKVNLLLDEAGNPIPDFTMLINQKGQPISPGTPVYDQSGQKLTKNGGQTSARPVLDYTGQQIGFTYDGKNVLNAQNIPIALLSSSGKLKTLIPPLDLANYQKVENTLVNSQGKLIATIHPNNLITDINGITFGKLNRLGQIELDNELARQVEKVAMSLPLKHKFVPQLLLPNEKGKDALFSVSERNPQISPDQSPARVFSISPEGVVVGPDGQPVGKLSPGSSQGSHALKDDRGNVVAIMNDKGELLTVDGRQLGVLSKPTSAPAEKQKTEAVGAAQNTRAESLGDHYSEVFKSFVPDLSPTTNGKERYQVTARGDIVDTATGVSLGTIGIPSRPLTVPFAVHIDKALYDSRGSITGYVLRDGHIVNPQGMTIGQLDASAKEPKALRHFLSDNGEVIGTFDADMGTLTDPNGSLIAKAVKGDSEDIILVDASGRELARINSSGKLTGLIQGVHVNKEIFESASKGEKVDPAIIKSLLGESKPAEDTSQAKESKVELGGLLLLSQDGKPIGRVNDKNQVLAENGSILGSIGTNGRFHPSAEASRDVTAGALVDSHGKMIAKYTESNGFTTNDGKRIFENSVEKQPEVSMKRVGGYFIDDKGHLINKDNQPVGRIHGNQVMSMDNKQVAILNSDGSLSDLAGNRIAESGDIVDAQGVVLGQLHLLSKNEKILPLAKNVPVIADVEGHKIIGVTMNGDFVIGIDEIGQPILGKVGYNKDGVKIAAIDIEGKPLPQNFVEDVVKISTAVGSSTKPATSKSIQQVVVEEDEDMEDTERKEDPIRSNKVSQTADPMGNIPGLAKNEDKNSHVNEEDEEGEEEEEEDEDEQIELLETLGGGHGKGKDGAKLVKTESFIHVPVADDFDKVDAEEEEKRKHLFDDMKSLSQVKDLLDKMILEEESKEASPEIKKSKRLSHLGLKDKLKQTLNLEPPQALPPVALASYEIHVELKVEERHDPEAVKKALEAKKAALKEKKKKQKEQKLKDKQAKKLAKEAKKKLKLETEGQEVVEEVPAPECETLEGDKPKKKKNKKAKESEIDADEVKPKKKKKNADAVEPLPEEDKPKKKKKKVEETVADEAGDQKKKKKKKEALVPIETETPVEEITVKKKKKKVDPASNQTEGGETIDLKKKDKGDENTDTIKKPKKKAKEPPEPEILPEEKPKKKKKLAPEAIIGEEVNLEEKPKKKKKTAEPEQAIVMPEIPAEEEKPKKKKKKAEAGKQTFNEDGVPSEEIAKPKKKKEMDLSVQDTTVSELPSKPLRKKKAD